MTNPIANQDQFACEDEVLYMWEQAQTRQARDHAAHLWRVAHGTDVPADSESRFDEAMDSWITNYLFKASVMDGNHPRFVRDFMPGYNWRGVDVPDARMGGDNPDNCYRLAGVRHGKKYRVTGQVPEGAPSHVSFTLVENWGTSVTVQTLEFPGITVDEDGRFTITIDEEPAGDRSNHMQTSPRVKFLYVRDSMMDWAVEDPLHLEIECINPDTAGILSVDERLTEALRRAREDVPLYYWFFRLSAGHPTNGGLHPIATANVGGLITQYSCLGRLHLEDDQAAIVQFEQGPAAYNSLHTAMWWYRSVDAHRLQSGLSAAQAHKGADNIITAVISAQDPGIANWLQTDGLKDLMPMVRWQGFGDGLKGKEPMQKMDVVPFREIEQHLPADILRIDATGRAEQIAARQAGWNRRVTL